MLSLRGAIPSWTVVWLGAIGQLSGERRRERRSVPQARRHHPLPKRLNANAWAIGLGRLLRRQRRTKVGISDPASDQSAEQPAPWRDP